MCDLAFADMAIGSPPHPASLQWITCFSSVAAELAVCAKHVGLARRPDLGYLEFTGPRAWLEHFLGGVVGAAPDPNAAVRLGDQWIVRTGDAAALVLAPLGALPSWRRLARHALVSGSLVRAHEAGEPRVLVSLIGPRAGDVLVSAGLAEVAPGGAAGCHLGGEPVVLLREEQVSALLVVAEDCCDRMVAELVEVGRPYGLSLVGSHAVARLRASRRRLSPA